MARQTREIWRNVIGQFERSGKMQEQFAAEREIPLTTLRRWIYRARRPDDGGAGLEVMLLRFGSDVPTDFIVDVVSRLRRC